MYPTKEQILSKNPNIKTKAIMVTLAWKDMYFKNWNKLEKGEQIKRLKVLIYWLNWTYEKHHDFLTIKTKNEYCYEPDSQTIYLVKEKPSIISALHELGHHLYGTSELKACRWSIWLFIACFPKQYNKLTWKGHLLIK